MNEAREHDAGIMFLGHQVSYFMAIPPKANNYTVSSYCPANCTHQVIALQYSVLATSLSTCFIQFFPETGINIFASMLHTHLAGDNFFVVDKWTVELNSFYRYWSIIVCDKRE